MSGKYRTPAARSAIRARSNSACRSQHEPDDSPRLRRLPIANRVRRQFCRRITIVQRSLPYVTPKPRKPAKQSGLEQTIGPEVGRLGRRGDLLIGAELGVEVAP